MVVLIAKQNQGIITELQKIKKFESVSVNTCTFKLSKNRFNKLFNDVRGLGYNPYALMNW